MTRARHGEARLAMAGQGMAGRAGRFPTRPDSVRVGYDPCRRVLR